MKRRNNKLLDDLLEDSVSPDFETVVMNKTLQSARQRRRMRHFSSALGIAAVVGIFAVTFREIRHQTVSSNQIRRETLPPTLSQPSLNHLQVVSTKPGFIVKEIQTSEADRPKEINDKELTALLSDQPVALVHYASGRAELISFEPK